MKKFLASILLLSLLSLKINAQNQKPDSAAIAQQEANKFIDSLTSHTSIKDFNSWLYENVSQKTANEGKFGELYNLFLQQQYQAWLQRKTKPKNK